MNEIIVPDMIDNLISVAKYMVHRSEARTIGNHIGFALGYAAAAKHGLAPRLKDKAMAEDALQFRILLEA